MGPRQHAVTRAALQRDPLLDHRPQRLAGLGELLLDAPGLGRDLRGGLGRSGADEGLGRDVADGLLERTRRAVQQALEAVPDAPPRGALRLACTRRLRGDASLLLHAPGGAGWPPGRSGSEVGCAVEGHGRCVLTS